MITPKILLKRFFLPLAVCFMATPEPVDAGFLEAILKRCRRQRPPASTTAPAPLPAPLMPLAAPGYGQPFSYRTPGQPRTTPKPLPSQDDIKEASRRAVGVNRAAADELREFVVTQDGDFEAKYKEAARIVASIPELSVENYKACEAQGDALRQQMADAFTKDSRLTTDPWTYEQHPASPTYHAAFQQLKKLADDLAQQIYAKFPAGTTLHEDPTNGGAFVFIAKELGIVYKVPNPFTSYYHNIARRVGGIGGENHSLRRQVNRVVAAHKINRECGPHGLKAPVKFVCLRPGATIDGPMNDRHLIIVTEFIGERLHGYYHTPRISNKQFDQFARAADFIGAADFHTENVWQVEKPEQAHDDLYIVDTEKTNAYLAPDRTGAFRVVRHMMHHPQYRRYERSKMYEGYEYVRNLWIEAARIAEDIVGEKFGERLRCKTAEIMRFWLPQYLDWLVEHGDKTEAQREELLHFWMGDDVEAFERTGGFVYWENYEARKAYLAGDTSQTAWQNPVLEPFNLDVFIAECKKDREEIEAKKQDDTAQHSDDKGSAGAGTGLVG